MKLFQPIQGSIESKETQENLIDRGQLQVNVTSSVNAFPVKEARISISYTGIPESILEQVVTDSSGQTELVELNAPPEEWSLDENEERQPYSEYTLNIEAEGFESISVSGTEILANTKAIQNIRMKQKDQSREEEQVFVIPAHTLYGNYPPKIAEEEIKPVNETGEIVLSRVVVPEYIIVHDGSPRDSTAQNYYVKYKEDNQADATSISKEKVREVDAIVIGGGSGLSSAAGYNHYENWRRCTFCVFARYRV